MKEGTLVVLSVTGRQGKDIWARTQFVTPTGDRLPVKTRKLVPQRDGGYKDDATKALFSSVQFPR